MTCFTEDIDSQETETLEVDSEGEKLRREPEEQNVDLSDQSLTCERNCYSEYKGYKELSSSIF